MASKGADSYLCETEKLIESFQDEPKSEGKREKGYLRTLKGISGTFVSVIMAVTSASTVQLLERRIPDLELNTYRFALPLVVCSAALLVKRLNPCMERIEMTQTLLYSTAVFMASFFYYVSVTLLPAATASCIMLTANLLGCLVLFSLVHKETMSQWTALSVALCITGLVMVLQPGFGNQISTFDGTTTKSERLEYTQLTLVTDNATQSSNHKTETMMQHVTEENRSMTNWKRTVPPHDRNSRSILTRFEEMIQPTSLIGQIIGYSFAVVSGLGFAWSILILKQNNFTMEILPKVLFWVFFVNGLISSF